MYQPLSTPDLLAALRLARAELAQGGDAYRVRVNEVWVARLEQELEQRDVRVTA